VTIELKGVGTDLMGVIEVFHGLIRDDVVPEIIPVDVADYRHLADEPRVLLVGHRGMLTVARVGEEMRLSYRHRRDPLSDAEAEAAVARVATRLGAAR